MAAKLHRSTRIGLAFAVAVIADLIQLPLSAAFDTAILAIPAEAAILVVDAAAFAFTTALLGFHWALLPSLAIEAIPNIDALPTWTGCVAFVAWSRRAKNGPVSESHPIAAIAMNSDRASEGEQ